MRAVLALVMLGGCLRTPPFAGTGSGSGSGMDAGADAGDKPTLDAPAATNLAFVTSVTKSVDQLAANPAGALAAADALCMTQANNNGHAGVFRAWLSAGNISAVSRLGGNTRGWSRIDGKPFADTVADLTAGTIFYPLRLDEMGNDIGNAEVMTATKADGTPSPSDCNALGGGSGFILIGNSDATTETWTGAAGRTCSTPEHLYCFQVELATPVVVPASMRKRAFLSTSWTPGGGVASADALCHTDATAAGLTGPFAAFISTSSVTAAQRFAGDGPWARLDGVELSDTSATMLGGKIDAPLNVDVTPRYHGPDQVWTGGGPGGTPSSVATSTCSNWTSSAPTDAAGTGRANRTDVSWFGDATTACNASLPLYCLEKTN